jgi:hypothetical protein
MNVMPISVSPWAHGLRGAAPDFVYWFTFLWSFFR